ncbi:tetratricopeptide repeat protein [Pseudoalteromonas denitrificans]|uniref:Tetratricopeptide repeat-containing protein n=1 Tax=Pseudoalteromonas denitrificans DSM 6059 TaxID=1123010 RepID=A0A1I1R2T1_9GAMM|nr:hypothetical protein [Pseudoalteromonas denitrificans]SFD28517.1 hypothetical protein SAMN02745724_04082 [Pseudoalteromonas denitrificans DSM 6059]
MTSKILSLTLILFSINLIANESNLSNEIAVLKQSFEQKKYQTVIDKIEAGKNTSLEKSLLLSQSYYRSNKLDIAENIITPLLKLNLNHSKTNYVYASIMAAQAQNSIFSALSYAKKALDGFKKALQLEPTNLNYLSALMQFYIKAPSIAGGDMAEGKKLVEQITKLDAREGFDAQLAYFMQDDNEDALEELFNKGLKQYPDDIALHVAIGHTYWSDKELEKAQKYFIKASQFPLAINKKTNKIEQYEIDNHLEALYFSGRIATETKEKLDIGITALENYIKQVNTPNDSYYQWAHFRLAQLYKLNKQPDKANTYFNWAYNNATDNKLKRKAKKQI